MLPVLELEPRAPSKTLPQDKDSELLGALLICGPEDLNS